MIDYFDARYPVPKERTGATIAEINSTYISSCSALEDDLTMWRLYGDDGKGVCLVFEVDRAMMSKSGFFISKVSYAENRIEHKDLKAIKEMIRARMHFREINIWKHFFKPHEYNVEEEIRIVYAEDSDNRREKEWICTWGHSIFTPVKDFPLSEIPGMTLKSIVLGPKFPERQFNMKQIEYMISGRDWKVEIDSSGIRNYR